MNATTSAEQGRNGVIPIVSVLEAVDFAEADFEFVSNDHYRRILLEIGFENKLPLKRYHLASQNYRAKVERVCLGSHSFIFKWVRGYGTREGRILAELSSRFPRLVPSPVSTFYGRDSAVMVLPDCGKATLRDAGFNELLCAVESLGRLHASMIELPPACVGSTISQSGTSLFKQIQEMVEEGFYCDHILHYVSGDLDLLVDSAEQTASIMSKTFIHGDPHLDNWILPREGGPAMLIDWAQASLSFPMVDFVRFVSVPKSTCQTPLNSQYLEVLLTTFCEIAGIEFPTPDVYLASALLALGSALEAQYQDFRSLNDLCCSVDFQKNNDARTRRAVGLLRAIRQIASQFKTI